MPADPTQDADFMSAAPHEQMAYLAQTDPDFAKASPQDQLGYLMHIRGLNPSISGPAKATTPQYGTEGLEPRPEGHIPTAGLPGSGMDRPVMGRDLVPGALLGGAAAAAVTPALAGAAIPAIRAAAQAHPILSTMLASEAISQARKIPYLGKLVPPYSEMIPMLMQGRSGASESAPTPTAESPNILNRIPGMQEPPPVVNRPVPAWKTQQQLPEGFNPTLGTNPPAQPSIGSTPEEIQANLQRIAQNAANRQAMRQAGRTEGQTVEQTPPVQIPAGKTAQAVGPAYSSPRTPASMETAQSSTIDLHGYHPQSNTMTVQFKNGNVYELRGVPPEVYENYRNSESQGSFYQQNLKGRYHTRLVGKIGKQSAGAKVKQALSNQ